MAAELQVDFAKKALQDAARQATSVKGKAQEFYNQEEEAGLTSNYPAWAAALNHYRAAAANYGQALQNVSAEKYQAWEEKVKQKARANPQPNGLPGYDVIVSPDE
ncbi:hypothetical protein ACJZ2D_009612 [Fusarium nematophilum]